MSKSRRTHSKAMPRKANPPTPGRPKGTRQDRQQRLRIVEDPPPLAPWEQPPFTDWQHEDDAFRYWLDSIGDREVERWTQDWNRRQSTNCPEPPCEPRPLPADFLDELQAAAEAAITRALIRWQDHIHPGLAWMLDIHLGDFA